MNTTCTCPPGACKAIDPEGRRTGYLDLARGIRCKATIPAADANDPIGTASAPALLAAAAQHMIDRAATYDKPEGERSMGRTVAAFNAITGRDLRESEGWLLLALLKAVRSEQRQQAHKDSIEDLIAYGALYGEARTAGR